LKCPYIDVGLDLRREPVVVRLRVAALLLLVLPPTSRPTHHTMQGASINEGVNVEDDVASSLLRDTAREH
jgi:hypothetical protein